MSGVRARRLRVLLRHVGDDTEGALLGADAERALLSSGAVAAATGELAQLKAEYDANGFVVLRRFLGGAQLAEARREADVCISAGEKQPKWLGIKKGLERESAYFEAQLLRGAHLPLLSALIEDEPSAAGAGVFDKLRGKSFPVAPHSDSGGARNGATLWISLDRADSTNGSISYLRGSHRRSAKIENADGVAKSADPFSMLDSFEEGWGEGEIFSMVAEPGDAVIHSSKTLHW